jgi:hypothetical protein
MGVSLPSGGLLKTLWDIAVNGLIVGGVFYEKNAAISVSRNVVLCRNNIHTE